MINDFNKQNWDWLSTNYEITFKLSKIIRKDTDVIEFDGDNDDAIFYDARGGSDTVDTCFEYLGYGYWGFIVGQI